MLGIATHWPKGLTAMSYTDFDDLEDPAFNAPRTTARAELTDASIHIANGGTSTARVTPSFPCSKCGGSGRFMAYTGRLLGNCFACKGTGKITARQAGAVKAKVTKEENRRTWFSDHATEVEYMRERADRWPLMQSFLDQANDRGSLSEKQIAVVHSAMAKDSAKKEERAAERVAAAPTVDIAALAAIFAKAVDNDIKRPIYRADRVILKLNRAKDVIYVTTTEGDTYLGKIDGGKFMATYAGRNAGFDVTADLLAIAADPLAESIKYARRTGACGVCGITLVDPVSIRAGIGPICAGKWGFNFRREAARDQLKCEAAEEAARA